MVFIFDSDAAQAVETCELACKDYKILAQKSIFVVFMNIQVVSGINKQMDFWFSYVFA